MDTIKKCEWADEKRDDERHKSTTKKTKRRILKYRFSNLYPINLSVFDVYQIACLLFSYQFKKLSPEQHMH